MKSIALWLLAFTLPYTFALSIGEDDKEVFPSDSIPVDKKQIEIVDPSEFLIVKSASVRKNKDGLDLFLRLHANSYSQKFSMQFPKGEWQEVRLISYRESVRTGVGQRQIVVNSEWPKKGNTKDKPIFHWYEGDIPAVHYFKATFPAESESLELGLRLKLDDDKTSETTIRVKLK